MTSVEQEVENCSPSTRANSIAAGAGSAAAAVGARGFQLAPEVGELRRENRAEEQNAALLPSLR
uniref:Predicted protein n=1 Tax=Hordeum vulgare subsp. vulgare TaxID=112509 RepID=F2DCY6_HORVV|nr:predicted protein [Hordeum vulgare subsp. vulgare]